MQDTKDRGQQAIIRTPQPIEPPPATGDAPVDRSPVTLRQIAKLVCLVAVFFLAADGVIHAVSLAFSRQAPAPWSWPHELMRTLIKAIATGGIAWFLLRLRR